MKKTIILGIGLVFTCLAAWGQSFSAFVNKKQVAVNENFQVSFRIDNGNGNIEYPNFEGFQLVGGPNLSSSTQFVNGKMSQSVTYSFYLRAPKEGTYTIAPASVTINGKTYTSEPVEVKVVKGAAGSAPSTGSEQKEAAQAPPDLKKQIAENLFLRATVNKRKVYQGEQLTLTYKIYTRLNGLNITDFDAPKFNGFWIEEVDIKDNQLRPEVLNGVQYRSAVFKQYVLFPQRAGELSIDPFTVNANVRVSVSPRSNDPFDIFFSRYQDVPYEFASEPVKLEVMPLPASGRPANFAGAVGSYEMSVDLERDSTQTGDPVTLKIQIRGQGNIKMVDRLRLEFPPDFEVYDPKINQRMSTSGGRVSGTKTFDYLLVPRNPGSYKLPQITFSYFDPEAVSYKTLSSREFSLVAEGEAQGESMRITNINKEEVELIGEDIRYIKTSQVKLEPKGQSFLGTVGFWSLSILPFLLFAGLLVFLQRRDAAAADVVGTRMRKANRMAKKRLTTAHKLQQEDNSKAFYDEVVRALWGYLADKLALSQAALSRESAREALSGRGVDEALISRLTHLLDTCEMALFAPSAAPGGMEQVYDEAVALIADIEKELK